MDTELLNKRKKIIQSYIDKKILISRELLLQIDKEIIQTSQETQNTKTEYVVEVTESYNSFSKKHKTQDFVSYFTTRFKSIESILKTRQELQNLVSISRISEKAEREACSIIGMIFEKSKTKNDNLILTVEDRTGRIKVVISKNNSCFSLAQDLVEDEVIGIQGSVGKDVVFANAILVPDIPLVQEIKKCPDDVYAVIISDIHTGSVYFLEEEFKNFLKWINGEIGTESQKEIAKKTGYVFVVGDLVDGVGIYPGQEKELSIKDIYKQYECVFELLNQIPKDKKIIICAGNHDAVRLSEPQPVFQGRFYEILKNLGNATIVSNPSYINIHSSDYFPGFLFLLYHGYSYDFYANNVTSIRNSGLGPSDRTDLVMRYLLQKRHLAPVHNSTLYIPDPNKDALVISKVPDFFISGHIHKSKINNYRGVSIITGSCFQAKTDFQEKVGHEPDPCKVPIINLKNKSITMMNFENASLT
ncbi:metallophosphoesterase [Candidatus Woesearchaeota archaeon]|nr:metallophosphoesterase [Candidatus Woesearchaeota archaeon]